MLSGEVPMTVQILFVQGGGEGTHDEWDNKLVASLEDALGAGTRIRYPRMPDEDDPRYDAWKAALLEELKSLEDGAILVGHSIGGTILLHVLAEERLTFRPAALLLIAAPFIGEGGWPSDEIAPPADLAKRLPARMPVFLYHGTEDQIAPLAHAQLHARAIPQAVLRALPGRDHQLNDDLGVVAEDIRSLN
jgi:predicted alpha/beta hydrolase family esterase